MYVTNFTRVGDAFLFFSFLPSQASCLAFGWHYMARMDGIWDCEMEFSWKRLGLWMRMVPIQGAYVPRCFPNHLYGGS